MSDRTSTSWDPTVPTALQFPIKGAVRAGRMMELADRLATNETPCYFLEVQEWVDYIDGLSEAPPAPGYGRSEAYQQHPSSLGEVA